MNLLTPYEMTIAVAKRFRALRRSKKITLKTLSTRSGVPYSTLRRFESTGEVSFAALVKLASAIGEDDCINSLFAEKIPESIEEVIRGNHK